MPFRLLAHDSEILQADLMAVPMHISQDRSRLVVDYLSKPVLADAAIDIISSLKKNRKYLYKGLFSLLISCDTGDAGELVVHCVLIQLLMNSLETNRNLQNLNKNKYLQSMTVIQFLKYLSLTHNPGADNDPTTNTKECLETDLEKTPLYPIMNGTIYITHFKRYEGQLNTQVLENCFRRGCAIVCEKNNRYLDFVIPVKMFVESNDPYFSYIAIQVKNRKTITTDHQNFESHIHQFSQDNNLGNDALGIWIELGSSKTQPSNKTSSSGEIFNQRRSKRIKNELATRKSKIAYMVLDMKNFKIENEIKTTFKEFLGRENYHFGGYLAQGDTGLKDLYRNSFLDIKRKYKNSMPA
ncbi:uncharacterized protein ASCRUDRAFT_73107 [Ascoidea rubescens DSM 1968]|uniref:Uncharacterized protein n=1 Tax=Ascoidea rubescens DSM 1968 TaxID=1344418 RepID=A0A1D2V865_9ASCO|nr:hypothetical protein ASCRUDRAFT_73107 [Ascoidea rubescens DSM 1968]ODV57819.1 hypothetical protein ASCRUDRAFT_73107 [Ascoidea rubescens DSM 1968]